MVRRVEDLSKQSYQKGCFIVLLSLYLSILKIKRYEIRCNDWL